MHDDVTTLFDFALISLLCLLTWTFDFVVKKRYFRPNRKVQYYITPVGGRRFYWRRQYKEEEEHAA